MSRHRFLPHLIIFTSALLLFGLGCKGLSEKEQVAIRPVTLEYWSVFGDPEATRDLIARYNAFYPHIKINFRRLRLEEYERELLNALAEDRGPDIVSLHHEWILEYQSKLQPMLSEVQVPRVVYKTKTSVTGEAEQQIERVDFETTRLYTPRQLERTFVAAVAEDVVLSGTQEEEIYGLPLSFDTLQLYYNRELLDKAGIPEPPKTWDAFVAGIKQLRTLDPASGEIVQAAAGLGRADNVERAADIAMLLMRQNGAVVQDEGGASRFDVMPQGLTGRTTPPGPEALAFYTDFANAGKNDVYTWNARLPGTLDLFSRGRLAYFFGYSYHRPQLAAAAPKLNYAVAPIPQLNPEQPSHMANYWVEAVTRKSTHPNEAWHFLNFATAQKNVEAYLKKTERPTALRALVEKQLQDSELEAIHPFVAGVLNGRGWYEGKDAKAAERIVLSMIRRINEEDARARDGNIYLIAARDAVQQLQTTR